MADYTTLRTGARPHLSQDHGRLVGIVHAVRDAQEDVNRLILRHETDFSPIVACTLLRCDVVRTLGLLVGSAELAVIKTLEWAFGGEKLA